jgi:hypothetical protein
MKFMVRVMSIVMALALAASAPVLGAESLTGSEYASPDQIIEVTPAYESGKISGQTYGAAQTVYTVGIQNFMLRDDTVTYSMANTGGIYVFRTGGTAGDWWALVNLPNGAIVDQVELQACDTSATGNILFGMARMDAPADTGTNVTPVGTTGDTATPGCAFFSVTPETPLEIDNRNFRYMLFNNFTDDTTSAIKVAAYRIFYHLQVSPAPATATFPGDVPTSHPFFRFVEALAAAGISGGCGAGSYCPDSPVTRGQMAVFLSTALGLHWPN